MQDTNTDQSFGIYDRRSDEVDQSFGIYDRVGVIAIE